MISIRPSESLDQKTKTFSSDKLFFDALFTSSNSLLVARILVYYKWARYYIPHIQQGLLEIAEKRFTESDKDNAKAWTAFLTGGILKDICLIPYLTVRGVLSEAGTVIRRSLEHVGVLTHFWNETSKAVFLGDTDSQEFRSAFVREANHIKAQELKEKGIYKRFAAVFSFPKPASDLYSIFSSSAVHGGSPLNVILSLADENSISCGFIDRSNAENDKMLNLIQAGIEILCVEISAIHGQYGKKYGVTPPLVGKGGRLLTALLSPVDNPSQEMKSELFAVQQDLGFSIERSLTN